MREAWPVIEPSRPMIWGWHIDAMAEHLEAAITGQINRLLIEVPPGCSKSLITGTFLPAYVWIFAPWYRWLTVGANAPLAIGEAARCRRLVEDQWYRAEFGIRWRLRDDQDTKDWYETTAGGQRLALGMMSKPIGRKGHCVLVDDPNDAEEVQSAVRRARVNNRYDNAFDDRVIDFQEGTRIIIAHRTHVNDLIGHCRANGGWEVLSIPEEWRERKRTRTAIGWTDPRKREGELLRPLRGGFGPAQITFARKKNLLDYMAKHQQEPRTAEGIRFKERWFKYYTRRGSWYYINDERGEYRFCADMRTPENNIRELFQVADGASSASNEADFTVISTFAITQRYDLVWLGCRRERAEIPDQPALLLAEYRKWNPQWVGVEAAYGNRALFQHSQRLPLTSRKFDAKGDKLTRATPAIVLVESGRVYMPDKDTADTYGFPLDDVKDELTSFTGNDEIDEHDDVVDTLSYAAIHHGNEDEEAGTSQAPFTSTGPGGAWQDWMKR